jgi:AP-1-like factor
LTALNDKYSKLEDSHSELNAAYEKLRNTIELLTKDDDAEGEIAADKDRSVSQQSSNPDTLCKLLDVLHDGFRGVTPVRSEGY